MHAAAIIFGAINLKDGDVRGKRVLEIGSRLAGRPDLRGSLRPLVESLGPSEYVGTDIEEGEGVDMVCPAHDIARTFGRESFDVVLCTEVLEHLQAWRLAVHNIKMVCRARGVVLLTTRSRGYPYHGFPRDFWRFDLADVEVIFADMELLVLQRDPQLPGVFLKARKGEAFAERDLSAHLLYSVLRQRRVRDFDRRDLLTWRYPILKLLAATKDGVYTLSSSLRRFLT
jgi:SAM-dependent methyltransferase